MNTSNCALAYFEDIYRVFSLGKEKYIAGEISDIQFSNLIKLLTSIGNKEFKDAQPVFQNSQDWIYLGN